MSVWLKSSLPIGSAIRISSDDAAALSLTDEECEIVVEGSWPSGAATMNIGIATIRSA